MLPVIAFWLSGWDQAQVHQGQISGAGTSSGSAAADHRRAGLARVHWVFPEDRPGEIKRGFIFGVLERIEGLAIPTVVRGVRTVFQRTAANARAHDWAFGGRAKPAVIVRDEALALAMDMFGVEDFN